MKIDKPTVQLSQDFTNTTNSNTVTIQAGVTSASYTLTLPTAVAAVSGYVLTSTDTGVLSWTAAAAAGADTALSNLASVAINTTLVSDTDNTDALGTSAIAWSDLFLGSGAVITFTSAPSTPDVTITHSANALAFAGASSGYSFDALITPTTNDAAALGSTTLGWSDLHLATGGVINWANGEITITETDANTLTIAGATSVSLGTSAAFTTGTIELGAASDTTIARDSAGVISVEGVVVPTISSTNTLTNKTIQAPIIDYVIEPAADDTYEGEVSNDILAGDTIAQWDLVYLDSTSGRWEFADADAAATAGGVLLALATAAGTDGNALNVLFRGIVRNDGWTWTGAGKPLYVSTTLGGMTETAPNATDDVVRVVGYTLSDDAIYFNPSNDWVTIV